MRRRRATGFFHTRTSADDSRRAASRPSDAHERAGSRCAPLKPNETVRGRCDSLRKGTHALLVHSRFMARKLTRGTEITSSFTAFTTSLLFPRLRDSQSAGALHVPDRDVGEARAETEERTSVRRCTFNRPRGRETRLANIREIGRAEEEEQRRGRECRVRRLFALSKTASD